MPSVLQPWLEAIPIRMQSTLILGLRGPDTHACPNVKKITRWLRGLAFKPGNPDNAKEFMGQPPDRIREKGPTAKELEFCTQHYYSHLMHALEVVAYRHPHELVKNTAMGLFIDMCSLFHLPVETKDTFEFRLCERLWPGGRQPNDFEEAVQMLDEPVCWHDNRGPDGHCLKCGKLVAIKIAADSEVCSFCGQYDPPRGNCHCGAR